VFIVFKFERVRAFLYNHCLAIIFVVLFFCVGFGSLAIKIKAWDSNHYTNTSVIITATVVEVNQKYIIVNNATGEYYSYATKSLEPNYHFNGKIYVYPQNLSCKDFALGDIIEVGGTLSFFQAIDDNSVNSLALYNGMLGAVYDASVAKTDLTTNTDIFMPFRENIRGIINENFDDSSAGLAYSMLFGDKSALSSDISESFKTTGISHLLAVSGLHVGFLVALLMGISKLMKVKKKTSSIVIAILIVLYAWICNFTPSVTRAAIMTMIILLSSTRGKQYDILNALSVGIIVILCINSAALFSLGFQLSVLAVFFIALLTKPIERFLSKFLPSGIASALGATIAAQVGTLPIILNIYGEYSLLSILANLIIVPIAGVAFEILVLFMLIIAILPGVSLVLKVPQLLFQIIIWLANLVASSKFLVGLTIDAFGMTVIIFASYVASHYVFVRKSVKIACIAAILLVLLSAVGNGLLFSGA